MSTTFAAASPKFSNQSPHFSRWLAAIVLLAILVRVGFVWEVRATLYEPPDDLYLRGTPGIPHSLAAVRKWNGRRGYALIHGMDMPKYVRYARMVLRGGILEVNNSAISPLAPLVLFPLYLLAAGNHLVGAMMWQGIVGALQCLLIALIGRRLVGDRAALLAAFFAAVYSTFIIYDALPIRETTLNLTMLLTVYTFLRLRENPSLWRGLLWGACLGLSIAAKPTMILLVLFLPLGDIWARGKVATSGLMKFIVAGLLVAAVVVFPFIWRVHHITGEWLLVRSEGGLHFLLGNNPQADGTFRYPEGDLLARFDAAVGDAPGKYARRDRLAVEWGLRFWREQPVAAFSLFVRKVGLYLSPREIPNNISTIYYRQISFLKLPFFLTTAMLWPLVFLGICLRVGRSPAWRLVLPFIGGYSLLMISAIVTARYRLPIIPFFLLWAAAGAEWLWRQRTAIMNGGRYRVVLLLVVFGLILTHWRIVSQEWIRWTQPDGFVKSTARGMLYRDGEWNSKISYGAILSHPAGFIAKDIILSKKELSAARVAVVFRGRVSGARSLILRVNEYEMSVRLTGSPTDKRQGQMSRYVISIPASCLREENHLELVVGENTALSIGVDDDIWYGRSWLSERGEPPRQSRLDTLTCRYSHLAHYPRGELQIGLFLAGSGAEPHGHSREEGFFFNGRLNLPAQ